MGENDYNKNEIQGIQLTSGSYTLEIAETLAQTNPDLRRCEEYTLQIGITPLTAPTGTTSASSSTQDFTTCPYMYLPPSFDSIAYLSEIGGNMIHFAGDVRMNVKVSTDL